MKRGFLLATDGHLTSTMVTVGSKDIFNIGDRVYISRPLDLGYAGLIETGEHGTVDFIDACSGMVEVLMDTYHLGLAPWLNHIWIVPYGTEDILSGIVRCACECIA